MLATKTGKVPCPGCQGTGQRPGCAKEHGKLQRCLSCKGTGEVEADRVCLVCHHFVAVCICPRANEGKEWSGLTMVRTRHHNGNGHGLEEGPEPGMSTRETIAVDPDADVIAKLRAALAAQREFMASKKKYLRLKAEADDAWWDYEQALDAACEWEDDLS